MLPVMSVFDDFLGDAAGSADAEVTGNVLAEGPEDPPLKEVLPSLSPYVQWMGSGLPAAKEPNLRAVETGLVEIIRTEGPMLGRVAFERYQQGSGGGRLDVRIQEVLSIAARRAVAGGRVQQITDTSLTISDATLFASGQDDVLLRELGPRRIFDVPKSEIVTAFSMLLSSGVAHDELDEELLSLFGLMGLTPQTVEFLGEARQYRWKTNISARSAGTTR